MGFGRSDVYPGTHFADDTLQEMTIRLHDGNVPIDVTSPVVNGSDAADLLAATGTQAAFDTAVEDIGGLFETWYNARTSPPGGHQDEPEGAQGSLGTSPHLSPRNAISMYRSDSSSCRTLNCELIRGWMSALVSGVSGSAFHNRSRARR